MIELERMNEMKEKNVVFETFYNRKRSFDASLLSCCTRLDEITFVHDLFPERRIEYQLDEEKTVYMASRFQEPICVMVNTFKNQTKTIVMMLKDDELLAGIFNLETPNVIVLEQKRFSEVGIFQPIVLTEHDYSLSKVNERFLMYLYETNDYRLPYVTGTLQVKLIQ